MGVEDRIFEALRADPDPRPRTTPSVVAAYAIAVAVTLVTVAIAAGGVFLLLRGTTATTVFGLLALAVAFVLRPRVTPAPDDVLPRAGFPETYALVDAVAEGLGAPRPAGIVVDDDFNAGVWRAGLRQRPYVKIGLPLWPDTDAVGGLMTIVVQVLGFAGNLALLGSSGLVRALYRLVLRLTWPDRLRAEFLAFLVFLSGRDARSSRDARRHR